MAVKMNQVKKELVPKLRFPEFKKDGDWEEKKLGEVGEIYQPKTISQTDLTSKGFDVYGANGIIGKYHSFNHEFEQIAITCRGSTCGTVNLTNPKSWITGNAMVANVDNNKSVSKKFIFYQLSGANLEYLISGSGQPQITGNIKKHALSIPPIKEEQQEIADCLSSLDELIEAQDQKLEALQRHKKGLMQDLFPVNGETLPRLRFPEFVGDVEWNLKPFSNFIKLYRGSSPRPIQEFLTKNNDGVNWIKIGDTKFSSNFIIGKVEEKITKKGAERSRFVEVGELILANSMSYGKTYKLAINGCIYDGWFVLREYEDFFYKPFLLQLLNSDFMQKQYESLSAGGIVQNISSEVVYISKLFHTSIPEQVCIADFLSSIDNLITTQTKKLESLRLHKKGLMQQLFPNISEAQ